MSYTLITGASGYLGGAFAEECLLRGEKLYLTGRNENKLRETYNRLKKNCPEAEIIIFPCDLSDSVEREKLFADAEKYKFSRAINAAGVDTQMAFALYDEKKLAFQIRACFEAAVSVCNFAVKHRADKLKIINVSSVSGIYPMPYFAVYSASKSALTNFSVALNEECKGTGISVTAVLPGAIYTRPDVVEYIKTQGLWGKIAAKSPEYVVKKSLSASDKGKSKAIIGTANKIMRAATALIPTKLKLKFIASKWSKTRKDAF